MAGTIIADYIRTDANKLSLNVGNTTFATINAMGFLSNTGVQIIGADGTINAAVLGSGTIPTARFAAASVPTTSLGAGAVLQVKTTTASGTMSTSSAGDVSISNGLQLFSLSFTPLSATSKIIVQTNTITVNEESNSGDWAWLGAWYGTTLIGASSGSPLYNHFSGNLNVSHLSLNHSVASWGTTAQTVTVRAAMNGGTAQINGSLGSGATNANIMSMTIWEIAQ